MEHQYLLEDAELDEIDGMDLEMPEEAAMSGSAGEGEDYAEMYGIPEGEMDELEESFYLHEEEDALEGINLDEPVDKPLDEACKKEECDDENDGDEDEDELVDDDDHEFD